VARAQSAAAPSPSTQEFDKMSMSIRRSGLAALVAGLGAVAVVAAATAEIPVTLELVQAQAGEAQKRADLLMKEWSSGGAQVKFGAVEPGSTPEGVVIKDIAITAKDNKTVRLGALEIRKYDWANHKEPKYVDVTVKQAVIAADAMDAEGMQNLKELGYAALTINADLAYKFDDASKTIDISKVQIDVLDAGEIRFALRLSGLSPADLKGATDNGNAKPDSKGKSANGGEAAIMGLLARINIVNVSLSFKDKSLVDRAIKADAKKKNISEDAAKKAILADLQKEKQEAQDDVTKEFIDTAAKFIANPGEITLAASPPAPVNLMGAFMMVMSNPGQLKQMLGLSLTTK
jgi:hypothetical protein